MRRAKFSQQLGPFRLIIHISSQHCTNNNNKCGVYLYPEQNWMNYRPDPTKQI